jgi:hypothetical protein
MVFNPNTEQRLDQLDDRLRRTEAITPDLFSEVTAQACVRLAALGRPARTRLDRLVASGAWTDAALALIALELPQWSLRRLVCEDGVWLCSLSKEPRLPLALDDLAEGTHEVLPLAILSAFLQARHMSVVSAPRMTTVPQMHRTAGDAVCCDNFA